MNNPELLSYQPTSVDTLYEFEVLDRMPIIVGDVKRILKPGVDPSDFDREFFTLVATSFNRDALYINSTQLVLPTNEVVNQMLGNLNPQETLVVFPGEGSKAVLGDNLTDDSTLKEYEMVFVPTRRIVENGKVLGVTVDLSEDLRTKLQRDDLKRVLIVDDVVATGTTLNTLRKEIRGASCQPLDFFAFAWFCRRPTTVLDYQKVRGIYRYWTSEGYPSLNSLSTWLKQDDKAKAVLEGYMKKYVRYPYGFEKQLQRLRRLTIFS